MSGYWPAEATARLVARRFLVMDLVTKLYETPWNGQDVVAPVGHLTGFELRF